VHCSISKLDVVAKPGSPGFKLQIALIKADFSTPDLPVTANFTGSFFQLSMISIKRVNDASSSCFSMLSFNSSAADFRFSPGSLNAI
jgi:beta-galactosidase GanA